MDDTLLLRVSSYLYGATIPFFHLDRNSYSPSYQQWRYEIREKKLLHMFLPDALCNPSRFHYLCHASFHYIDEIEALSYI